MWRAAWISSWLMTLATCAHGAGYFEIQVVDEATGRGVPLVELTTTSNARFVTDSAGRVAFHEPDLMGREVYFSIKSHGYEYPADGFGFRGARLTPKLGERTTLKVKRTIIAERIYRITGEGLYRDTQLLGHKPPLVREGLPGNVMGQDSVQVTQYQGKLYWFYGDTNLAHYPLGIFRTAGAMTPLPGKDFDPERGVPLQYFVDANGRARNMMPLTGDENAKQGVVWIDGVVTVPDEQERERMVCHWTRLKSLGEPVEKGMGVWNDQEQIFEPVSRLKLADWRHVTGPVTRVREGDQDYLLGGLMYLNTRVPARLKDVLDPEKYEGWANVADDTDAPTFAWRLGVEPFFVGRATNKQRQGKEALHPVDVATGKPVVLHGGSIRWNKHRQKWIAIGVEQGGTSFLGEVWYSEADAPTGPWRKAIKIVSHDKYSFYNPVHHAFLDAEGGRVIYFEGTYTHTFSGNNQPTPHYDYNQIMYRLNLDDPRLKALRE